MKVLDNHVLEVLQTKKTLDIALNREKVEAALAQITQHLLQSEYYKSKQS